MVEEEKKIKEIKSANIYIERNATEVAVIDTSKGKKGFKGTVIQMDFERESNTLVLRLNTGYTIFIGPTPKLKRVEK